MVKKGKEDVLKIVTTFYLKSKDFNGIHIHTLLEKYNQDWTSLKNIVKELIESEMVGLIYTDNAINPYIIRIGFESKEVQISKLNDESPPNGCIYPTPKHLNSVVNPKNYEGQPYKLCLALGEALTSRSSTLNCSFFKSLRRGI